MKSSLKLCAAAGLAVAAGLATAALAQDNPGGGGTRVERPVTGEQVYRSVCAACHMPDGKGATGAGTIPAMAENPRLATPAYPIMIVANGKGAMPWMKDLLTPAQIAAVVGYVRTHFGNNYPEPVTEAEVKQFVGETSEAAH